MSKKHLGEIDYIRVMCLIAVVALHAWGFFRILPVTYPVERSLQDLSINLLRFSRQGFMFVTGLVLFYTYNKGTLHTLKFFKKRLQNLVLPYAFWTIAYLFLKHKSNMVEFQTVPDFLSFLFSDLATGNGFYHMYYILVAIQFYFLFPLLALFKPQNGLRWTKIMLLTGLLLYSGYHYIFEWYRGSLGLGTTPVEQAVSAFLTYKDRIVFSYLPYYLLGGLAGMNIDRFRVWIERNGKLLKGGFALATGVVLGEFVFLYLLGGQPWGLTVSVFKPSIFFYSLFVIAFIFRYGLYRSRTADRLRPVITILAANSLGIYLIHPMVLYYQHTFYVQRLIPILSWPIVGILDLAAAIVISCLLSSILYRFRFTRFIVGEAGQLRQKMASQHKDSAGVAR